MIYRNLVLIWSLPLNFYWYTAIPYWHGLFFSIFLCCILTSHTSLMVLSGVFITAVSSKNVSWCFFSTVFSDAMNFAYLTLSRSSVCISRCSFLSVYMYLLSIFQLIRICVSSHNCFLFRNPWGRSIEFKFQYYVYNRYLQRMSLIPV